MRCVQLCHIVVLAWSPLCALDSYLIFQCVFVGSSNAKCLLWAQVGNIFGYKGMQEILIISMLSHHDTSSQIHIYVPCNQAKMCTSDCCRWYYRRSRYSWIFMILLYLIVIYWILLYFIISYATFLL